jgi:hypothetical protein
MSTDNLVELIVKAISYKYPKDAMRPGLTTAVLNNGEFYASIIRHNVDGKVKLVVMKAQAPTLDACLKSLAKQLTNGEVPKNPLELLAEEVASKPEKKKIAPDNAYNGDDMFAGDEDMFPAYHATWGGRSR